MPSTTMNVSSTFSWVAFGGVLVDLVYLFITTLFFLLSGWLISALDRL